MRSITEDGLSPEACYVQTAQLDGETNLKLRTAVPNTVAAFPSEHELASFRGIIRAEAPNGVFDRFAGTIQMSEDAASGPAIPLEGDQVRPSLPPTTVLCCTSVSSKVALGVCVCVCVVCCVLLLQLLLRGCVLRNVTCVYAVVLYTGSETKVRVKQTDHSRKRAQVESLVNRQIVFLVVLLVVFCVVGTIGYAVWTNDNKDSAYYLRLPGANFGGALERLLTFFLLNSNFIPVSLYVSMKLARTAQKFFMERDIELYYEVSCCPPSHGSVIVIIITIIIIISADVVCGWCCSSKDAAVMRATQGESGQYPMQVRTMDLNDELGQISHIFSDKTGPFTLGLLPVACFFFSFGCQRQRTAWNARVSCCPVACNSESGCHLCRVVRTPVLFVRLPLPCRHIHVELHGVPQSVHPRRLLWPRHHRNRH